MNYQNREAQRPRRRWIPASLGLLLLSFFSAFLFISSYDINAIKPLLTRLAKENIRRELLIHGPIKIEFGLSPSLVVEDVALCNAPWGGPENMIQVEQLKLQVRLLPLLARQIEVQALTLVGPTIHIETDFSGKSNFSFDSPRKAHAARKRESGPFRLGHILVEKGRLSFKEGGGRIFSVAVARLEARRAAESLLMELEAEGVYGSEPFRVQGVLGTLESLLHGEEPWPMDVAARAFEVDVRMEGSLPKPLSLEGLFLKVKADGKSTHKIARLFDRSSLPEWGPFTVEGEVWGKKNRGIQISGLKVGVKGLAGGGELELDLKEPTPQIKGALDFRRLDIPQLFQASAARNNRQVGEGEKKVFSPEPFPFLSRGFGRIAADLQIEADTVLLANMALSELKGKVRFSEDRLQADSWHFKVGGGEVQGAFEVDLRGKTPRLIVQSVMDQVDVHTFLKEKSVSGKAAAEIDLIAEGSSLAAWTAGLEGYAFLSISALDFHHKALNKNGSKFGAIILQIFAPASTDPNSTEINCLVGGFEIRGGLAEVTTLLADTHEVVVLGKGRVNLREETLDLSLRPYPKKGVAGVSVSVIELTKAFNLGGTLAAPSLRVDPLRSVLTVGKMLGGMLLLGPAGAAVVFAGQTASDGDLCLAAMEAARKGGEKAEATIAAKEAGLQKRSKTEAGAGDSMVEKVGNFLKNHSSASPASVDVYGGP